CLQDYTTPRTF
nr:immunoglobulin light chain junction region [Macaca mulatta]MOW43272.1 immunoglobulin light chain junction region [Macaca mulatta]MOW43859.1 immunoglobulin light chain junction region [Macaca mulatta]MOW44703.1 immunoglobulin light chain junction region [Macaca mulatta]